VTVHPGSVAKPVLETIDTLIVVGDHVDTTVRELCEATGVDCPKMAATGKLPPGQALYWRIGDAESQLVQVEMAKTERTRHVRKYIEGNLGKVRSFYFRGPDNKLNLRAHNLMMFVHLALGVDEDTWVFHAKQHDYSKWLRAQIKDSDLADEVLRIEQHATPSREALRAAIEKRYTLPADKASGIVDEEVEHERSSQRHVTAYP
jgi:hypothetical protein